MPSKGRPEGTGLNSRRRCLTAEEQVRLLKAADKQGPRYAAAFHLILFLALRVGEAAALKLSAINRAASPWEVNVKGLKGGKTKTYELPTCAKRRIERWLESKERPESEYLFPAFKDVTQPMSRLALQETFQRLLKATGITDHFTIHDLRVTAITDLANRGGSLADLRWMLRHQSFAAAQSYAEDAQGRAIGAVRAREWDRRLGR